MSDYPPDYDPKGTSRPGRREQKALPAPPKRDPNAPYELDPTPVFGRKPAPIGVRVSYPPICQQTCRLASMGECPNRCRLMARS